MKTDFNYLTIIPARAGSQRLPGKNMRLLGEIPLIGHSIAVAKANSLRNIVVTTNDAKVSNYAREEGVGVIDRPDYLAGDLEPTITALKHSLEQQKQKYDAVILLQPTNPLRPKNLLQEALHEFEKADYDSLMTVSKSDKKLGRIVNNSFIPFNYEIGQRSQDLEPVYYENGLLYIIKAEVIKEGKILGEKNCPFIVDHPFAEIDIDTLTDFKKAEVYLKADFE
ncbi:cytidylyltransferase domain-containing protein [Leeuwenhoekiella sp. A16]|uniref:acylneuraminate cytidylyltransferase family protein n=1 Tax=Leeuwenhoekiella sp. A16 TaxID=3141462 RepID=UPI003A809B74